MNKTIERWIKSTTLGNNDGLNEQRQAIYTKDKGSNRIWETIPEKNGLHNSLEDIIYIHTFRKNLNINTHIFTCKHESSNYVCTIKEFYIDTNLHSCIIYINGFKYIRFEDNTLLKI